MTAIMRMMFLLACLSSGALAEDSPAVELELGAAYDRLDQGYADWRTVYVDGAYTLAPRQTLYGGLQDSQRFGLHDQSFTLGAYQPLSENLVLLAEASLSPTARVLPEWTGLTQLQWTLPAGWGLQLGYRQLNYEQARIHREQVGIERYWGQYRLAYTFFLNQVENAGNPASHLLQGSYYYGEGNQLTLNLAAGRETENIAPNGVISTDVRSAALTGLHWILPNWGLRYELGLTRQGDFYTRETLRLGIRHRF